MCAIACSISESAGETVAEACRVDHVRISIHISSRNQRAATAAREQKRNSDPHHRHLALSSTDEEPGRQRERERERERDGRTDGRTDRLSSVRVYWTASVEELPVCDVAKTDFVEFLRADRETRPNRL